jgi:hypothetical protein
VSESWRDAVKPLASLRLTVVLLALSIFLIFAGTWAQIDMGIWTTLKTYFRSYLVWIPFQIFCPRRWNVPGAFPYPGGTLLGTMLMINLLTAHAVRFKWKRRQLGIWLVHLGIVLLLAGEGVTALFAEENNMAIDEGQTVNYAEDIRVVELAVIDKSDAQNDRVVAIPQSMLRKGRTIHVASLPFDLRIDQYFSNARLVEAANATGTVVAANRGIAVTRNLVAQEQPVVSGVEMGDIDLPVALVTPVAGGQELGTWMASLYFSVMPQDGPQEITAGNKVYQIALRHKRVYKPYSVKLLDFKHDVYLGTNTPKNFSSRIQLIDPSHNENREVLIYMNNPLRYQGETFYQASFKEGDVGTVLQVVRNPGWLVPYIACAMGALGLLIHFGGHLLRFVNGRKAA